MSKQNSTMLEAALAKIDAELAAERENREDEGRLSAAALVRARFDEFERMSAEFPHTWKGKVAAAINKAIGREIDPASVGTEMSRVRKQRLLDKGSVEPQRRTANDIPARAKAVLAHGPSAGSAEQATEVPPVGEGAEPLETDREHPSSEDAVPNFHPILSANDALEGGESEATQHEPSANEFPHGSTGQLLGKATDSVASDEAVGPLDPSEPQPVGKLAAHQKIQALMAQAKDRRPDESDAFRMSEDVKRARNPPSAAESNRRNAD